MPTSRLAMATCPYCDFSFNAATRTEGTHETPREGDPGVCGGCASILFFDAQGQPSRPRPGAMESFRAEAPDLWIHAQAVRAAVIVACRRTGRELRLPRDLEGT